MATCIECYSQQSCLHGYCTVYWQLCTNSKTYRCCLIFQVTHDDSTSYGIAYSYTALVKNYDTPLYSSTNEAFECRNSAHETLVCVHNAVLVIQLPSQNSFQHLYEVICQLCVHISIEQEILGFLHTCNCDCCNNYIKTSCMSSHFYNFTIISFTACMLQRSALHGRYCYSCPVMNALIKLTIFPMRSVCIYP